ncbi:MAG: hypothetical protein KGL35_07380 [Bradyrhizobium sp.]|nr:hypothetical protein [Bradyrhizobium sp.]
MFGSDLFPNGWGMLGNDNYGDCTVAGADHINMLWLKAKGVTTHFTDVDALDDYEAFGYVPGKPATDQGADMVAVAQYWQATGMRDWIARRHQIAAYASIEGSDVGAPDLDHVYLCSWLFGAVGIGIMMSQANEDQFDHNETWTPDSDADEYHFVPVIGRGPAGLLFITWGKACWMSEDFFRRNCKEALAYLYDENDPNARLFAEAAQ